MGDTQEADGTGPESPPDDAAPANPLEELGLGPMWRPTPAAFMWRRLNFPTGDIFVLGLFNVGGAFGAAFNLEELEGFVVAATKQLDKARALNQLVKPAKQLLLPNREQRRHPRP